MTSISTWYPRYVGDYQRKTSHLSLVEQGAYGLLLDHYYSTGKPLPANAEQLHRICRAFTPDEQAAVGSVLAQFFTLKGGVYHNDRADEELLKRSEISKKRQKAALSKSPANAKQLLPQQQQQQQQHLQLEPQTQPEAHPDKKEREGAVKKAIWSTSFNLKNQKGASKEEIRAKWLSNICKELERTITPDKYALWLEAYANGDKTAIELAEATDQRMRREKQRRVAP